MRSTGTARRLVVGSAIAGGVMLLAIAAWLLAPLPPTLPPPASPPSGGDHALEPECAAPVVGAPASAARLELEPAVAADAREPSAGVAAAVERSLALLARDLADPEWRRVRWDDEVGALAACLPDEAQALIARRLDDANAAVAIAAADLLRACASDCAALLSVDCVAMLRGTALDGADDSSASQVAARVLAHLGGEDDLARLTDRLVRPASETQRTAAGWALRAAPADRLVPALLRPLKDCAEGTRDDRAAESALIALDEALHRASGDAGPSEFAGRTVPLLERLLADPKSSEPTRLRALAAGATLATHDENGRGAALLRACVGDAGAPSTRRLRAAELLMGLPRELAPDARRDALDHLMAVARDGKTVRERRRAWSALAAAAGDASVGAELAELAQSEPDATVREVAAGTLARLH